jgi:hypothetical protein
MNRRPLVLVALAALAVAVAARAVVPADSTYGRIEYSASGAGKAFTFAFPTYARTHVEVFLAGVKQSVGYTVTLNANQSSSPGGTVTFTNAPAAGTTVRIQRTVPYAQDTVYTPYSAFPAKTTEKALDLGAQRDQQLARVTEEAATSASAAQAAASSASGSAASSASAAWNSAGAAAQARAAAEAAVAGIAQGSVGGNDTPIVATGTTRANSAASRAAREVWVTDFTGIDPTGASSSTAAMKAASDLAVANGSTLRFPAGTFILDATLATTNIDVRGEGPEKTIVWFYGTGDAARFYTAKGNSFSGIRFVSKAAGQNGLHVDGEFPRVDRVRLEEFDGTALDLDVAFYSDVRNVNIRNITTQGTKGVHVLWAVNVLEGVVVTGRFTTMVHLAGNKNRFLRGNVNPDTRSGGVTDPFLVDGVHNEIRGTYYELVTGSGTPTHLISFGANSKANTVSDMYFASLIDTGGGVHSGVIDTLGRIVDAGFANEVSTKPLGSNYQVFPSDVSSQNLLPNAGFDAWYPGTTVPYGWTNMAATGILTRETTTQCGSRTSLKVTGADENIAIGGFVTTPTASYGSLEQIPIEYLRGKVVAARVTVKSSYAATGNLRIMANGTGTATASSGNHTGGGGCEVLTAMLRVPDDATQLGVQLRSNAVTGVAKLTGDMWFSEPMLVVGTVLPHYSPRPLTDAVAQMAGPFAFAPAATFSGATPSVAGGNVFKAPPGVTITNFTNGKQSQEIVIWDPTSTSTLANNATIATASGAATALTAKPRRLILDGTVWREF